MLEIIVAIAILGLLAGVLISNITGQFDQAQVDVARTFVKTSVDLPLTSYRLHMGDYPSSQDGLGALWTAPQGRSDRWRGPYLTSKVPEDPWGQPYQYRYPGTHNKARYDLWSNGPDKTEGTADDICNWETTEAAAQ